MFIGPCTILIVEYRETNLMSLALLFLYLTLWPWRWTFIFQHTIYVNWIFYEPKKGTIVKYRTFCGGINGDGASKFKKIHAIYCWLNIQEAFCGGKRYYCHIQDGSNMTGTNLCVNKPHCAASRTLWHYIYATDPTRWCETFPALSLMWNAMCLAIMVTKKESVPVIFEPPCI